MRNDKRRSRRRTVRYMAWVVQPTGEKQVCHLFDISDTGARLEVAEPETVPDRFLLWLAANGSARRTCTAVWRDKKQIGVRFEQRLPESEVAMMRESGAAVPGDAA